ncbi:MAG TPA: HD-GYP domain-containing protein [Ktedonobacteraceae bacterium]|nr:HD-GYP domain-containing protein [Ktedonobacteraceae bacterium]
MILNGAVVVCLGNFLRQELRRTLECYGTGLVEDGPGLASAIGMGNMHATSSIVSALEEAVIETLNTCCDPETSAHAQRLVPLVETLGRQLRLTAEEILLLRLSALLHDIGKAGIPPAILSKPGPLDDHEWRIIRRHPEIGQYSLLLAGGVFALLAPIVVAHHEAWNGSGYPSGLQGEDIPLLARILTVVDSYDAMTSCRAYGTTLSQDEARRELRRCAGSQYDPRVVTAFLAVLDERNAQTFPLGPALHTMIFSSQCRSVSTNVA